VVLAWLAKASRVAAVLVLEVVGPVLLQLTLVAIAVLGVLENIVV
jgi:hypothetical protein